MNKRGERFLIELESGYFSRRRSQPEFFVRE
jgi:hypothetical protein